jgi:hypothetical protein
LHGLNSARECAIQIYVPISHPLFLWYLEYKIGENPERGKKADVEHWLHVGMGI